jgi:hypothetical protein
MYNFIRVHQILGTPQVVVPGVANHVWTIAELVAMMERLEERDRNHD